MYCGAFSYRFEDMDELVEHINSKHKKAKSPSVPPPPGEGDNEEETGGGGEQQQQGESHVNGVASGVSGSALFRLSFLHLSFSIALKFQVSKNNSHIVLSKLFVCINVLLQHFPQDNYPPGTLIVA